MRDLTSPSELKRSVIMVCLNLLLLWFSLVMDLV